MQVFTCIPSVEKPTTNHPEILDKGCFVGQLARTFLLHRLKISDTSLTGETLWNTLITCIQNIGNTASASPRELAEVRKVKLAMQNFALGLCVLDFCTQRQILLEHFSSNFKYFWEQHREMIILVIGEDKEQNIVKQLETLVQFDEDRSLYSPQEKNTISIARSAFIALAYGFFCEFYAAAILMAKRDEESGTSCTAVGASFKQDTQQGFDFIVFIKYPEGFKGSPVNLGILSTMCLSAPPPGYEEGKWEEIINSLQHLVEAGRGGILYLDVCSQSTAKTSIQKERGEGIKFVIGKDDRTIPISLRYFSKLLVLGGGEQTPHLSKHLSECQQWLFNQIIGQIKGTLSLRPVKKRQRMGKGVEV